MLSSQQFQCQHLSREIFRFVETILLRKLIFNHLNSNYYNFEFKQAQLMGVAAIDVPLYEFERLFQQFRLGVNGYAFVMDENGNVLTHPDFRPLVSLKCKI